MERCLWLNENYKKKKRPEHREKRNQKQYH